VGEGWEKKKARGGKEEGRVERKGKGKETR
jgi:hypothetical protein